MTSDQIRRNFFSFMTEAPRNHKEIPNISLVPVNDPTLLFTNSGMFPLGPYLQGEQHPKGKRLCNFQRCLRTLQEEIAEIGDNRHTLMFEMMGNWSLGDYFKKEQIPWVLKLYVEEFGLDPKKLYVTVWAGDETVPRDDESIKYWIEAFKKYDIDAEFCEDIHNVPLNTEEGDSFKYRIYPYGRSDNWWQRGDAVGELGGPSSEIFFDTGMIERVQDKYHINDDSGRFIEIGNSVFMEYKLDEKLEWKQLSQKNVDFGGGFERVVMCSQEKSDIFETDLFFPIIQRIAELSNKPYKTDGKENEFTASFRVLTDHIRAATFIIADGIIPANKDQGYILRSLIRRMIRYSRKLEIERNFTIELSKIVIDTFSDVYPQLSENRESVYNELEKEELKFAKTLDKGLKEFQKLTGKGEEITGEKAFRIYETYGFPLELIIEEVSYSSNYDDAKLQSIKEDFNIELDKHREQSRKGAEQKFKGGLADSSEKTTALHTTHHLLLAALQETLGQHVKQRGSNITQKRLRIDISHNEAISKNQLQQIEDTVNKNIKKHLRIEKRIMPKSEAERIGAEMEFGKTYGDLVTVFSITDQKDGTSISQEFCGGPHVANTSEIEQFGEFKIIKEKSNGAGIRRIKAILE